MLLHVESSHESNINNIKSQNLVQILLSLSTEGRQYGTFFPELFIYGGNLELFLFGYQHTPMGSYLVATKMEIKADNVDLE